MSISAPQESVRAGLFPKLTEAEIAFLTPYGQEIVLNTGETLFDEGGQKDDFFVILSGELKVTRRVSGEEMVLAVHSRGDFTGALSILTHEQNIATGRALSDMTVICLNGAAFRKLIATCPSVSEIILSAMAQRRPEAYALTQQREKMAALGKLSAGLAHELNNPASSAQGAANHLRETFADLQGLALRLGERGLSSDCREHLLQTLNAPRPEPLGTLARGELEDQLSDWMDNHAVANGSALSAPLAEAGINIDRLNCMAENLPPETLPDAVRWLGTSLDAMEMLQAVEQSAKRISDLVKAIKSYSYMDQAPTQEINIAGDLDNTLTILAFKSKKGIEIVRDYQADLPCITGHGSELNQVWTNLLDNAMDALDGKGQITLRTAREDDHILVEIADNGPGIPQEIQNRVFEPFFTTKGVGQGTGLGLDTAYRIVVGRHHGDIHLKSSPGSTCFQVRLPIQQPLTE